MEPPPPRHFFFCPACCRISARNEVEINKYHQQHSGCSSGLGRQNSARNAVACGNQAVTRSPKAGQSEREVGRGSPQREGKAPDHDHQKAAGEQIATAPTDPYFTTDILPFRPDHQELDLICDPPMLHATKPLANEARRQRLVLLLERQQQLSQQSTVLEHRP